MLMSACNKIIHCAVFDACSCASQCCSGSGFSTERCSLPCSVQGCFVSSELAVCGQALVFMGSQAALPVLQLHRQLVLAGLQGTLPFSQGSAHRHLLPLHSLLAFHQLLIHLLHPPNTAFILCSLGVLNSGTVFNDGIMLLILHVAVGCMHQNCRQRGWTKSVALVPPVMSHQLLMHLLERR